MGGLITVSAKHLEKRHKGTWYAAVYTPKSLHGTLGPVLRRSLETKDEAEAIRRRDKVVAELKAIVTQAEARQALDPNRRQTVSMLAGEVEKLKGRIAELEAELAEKRTLAEWGMRQIGTIDARHPLVTKPAEVVTFGTAAERFIDSRVQAGAWKRTEGRDSAPKTWRSTLANHAASLMDKPVAEITTADIMETLAKPVPQKLRPMVEQVIRYAKAQGWRTQEGNPASLESLSLPPPKRKEHHDAMPWAEVPGFVTRLVEKGSVPAQALLLTVLTGCRKSEVAGMRWPEIDLKGRKWTIPAERMKAGREHIVPLSGAALAVLRARKEKELPRDGGYVFPSRKGNAGLSHNAMDAVMQALECEYTIHGFRSSFRDWCADNGKDDQAAEFCLAHVKGGVEGAYFRTTMLEKRAEIMARWAKFCTGNA